MSLFDSMKSAASDFLNSKGFEGAKIVQGVSDLVDRNGGIQGLVNQFKSQGMSEAVSSWIGTGKNISITKEQLTQALGSDVVKTAAAKLGISPEEYSAKLAEHLPKVIDHLTPNGQLDASSFSAENLIQAGKKLIAG